MPPDIDVQRAAQHPLAAGLAGALIGLRWAPGATLAQRIINVVTGSLLAGYLGPAAAELLGQTSPAARSAIGFGLGLFGLSMAGSLARALSELPVAQIISSWITRR